MLALLLLQPNATVGRDRLIDELWGEAPPETAVNTLQAHVASIRRALGAELVETRAGGYALAGEAGHLDAGRFERLAESGRAAASRGENTSAARLVAAALALWRGPAFSGIEETPAVRREAERLEELRLDAHEELLAARLALGRHADLVADLEARVGEHPLRERPRAQLMLALYRCGRQADALAVYRAGRTVLVDELGIEPGAELQRLEQAILRQDPGLDLELPAERRLPLPAAPTALVGRERELVQASEALRAGTRLLTLVGPGGIGKSRLALELAHRLEPEFRGGAAFVPLDAVAEPARVAPAIATALELDPHEPLPAQLREHELLLVLDNFEQVVEAAPLIAEILAAAPGVAVVATSRALLRVAAEERLSVPPLAPDDAEALFVRRARAVAPELDPADYAEAIAETCLRLEGLPLALELAAGHLKVLTPPALLERLARRLDLLGAGARDAPRRQQTMRGAIDWSFELLTADEQRLLARFSVFAGGASIEAVAAVAGEEGAAALGLIESLVEKSLLRASPAGGESRVSALEVVREYALERLAASGDEQRVRGRHLAYYAALADAFDESDSSDGPEWYARLEAEHDNLRAALRFAFETGDSIALRLVAALGRFWRVHGHFAEGREWFERALGLADAAQPLELSKAWNGFGILAGEQADYETARHAFERSLELARSVDDLDRVAVAVANLGNVSLFAGDYPAARRRYLEAVEIYRASGHHHRMATNLENMAAVAYLEGDLAGARELAAQSVAAAREAANTRAIAASTRAHARILIAVREAEQARALLAESLDMGRDLGDPHGIAQSLEVASALALDRGDAASAARMLGAAGDIREAIGAPAAPDLVPWLAGLEAATLAKLGQAADAALRAEGASLSVEEAVREARGSVQQAGGLVRAS